MQSLTYSSQITSRELSLFYSQYSKYYQSDKTTSDILQNKESAHDTLEISSGVQELKNSGFKLNSSNINVDSSNLKFQYNFSNNLIQVQSSGNYNIYSNNGSLTLSFDLTKLSSQYESGKVSILPKEIKIKLDFSLSEIYASKEKTTQTKSPDILQIVLKIINKISDILKDGQDKEIKLSFEDMKTLMSFMSAEKGKLAKSLIQFLEVIAKTHNLNDADGKRDKVTLIIPDKETTMEFDHYKFSMSMTNITAEFKYPLNSENESDYETQLKDLISNEVQAQTA
jgi:hypothetical protein